MVTPDQPQGSAAPTMASMTDDPFIRTTPAVHGMEDVLWCYRRKLLTVEWSRKREPSCEHYPPGDSPSQPASVCRVCKDSQRLADWRGYWTRLKYEASRIRAEHDDGT